MAMVALAIGADSISTEQRREGIIESLINLPGTVLIGYVVLNILSQILMISERLKTIKWFKMTIILYYYTIMQTKPGYCYTK